MSGEGRGRAWVLRVWSRGCVGRTLSWGQGLDRAGQGA